MSQQSESRTSGSKYSLGVRKQFNSVSVPQYIATHQSSTPVIRTEYCELQDIGLVSYKSLYNPRHEWTTNVR